MLIFTRLVLLAALLCASLFAHADIGDQLDKFIPDDGTADDEFGWSVAIDGDIALVGSGGDDSNGDYSGSAYLFDVTTGSQLFKLTPDNLAAGDEFGYAVAIDGNVALVGAGGDDDNGDRSGSAYLFDVTTGNQLAKLTPEDGKADEWFGWSVAIDGDTALVGAFYDDGSGAGIRSGSAYLFDVTTGNQLAKLTPDDGTKYLDRFGYSVAIAGNTALVSAWGDDDNGSNSGSVYLFDVTTGEQIATLHPDDGDTGDRFGSSVSIAGDIALVGARSADLGFLEINGPYLADTGTAYVFDVTTGDQLAKLIPDDPTVGDSFGWSVAIEGDIALVGAHGDDDNGRDSGSAYLFDVATGNQLAKLTPDDGAWGDRFGVSVAIDGDTALIGAWRDGDNGEDSGSAYLFSTVPEPSTTLLAAFASSALVVNGRRAS